MNETINAENKHQDRKLLSIARHNVACSRLIIEGNNQLVYEIADQSIRERFSQTVTEVSETLKGFEMWLEAVIKQKEDVVPAEVGLSGDDCLDVIKKLSNSQGFYGRCLRNFQKLDPVDQKGLLDTWSSKRFKSDVDFILWLENGGWLDGRLNGGV